MSIHDHPMAVLSDIHGNRWALEAVLEDIEKRGIAAVFNLGDGLYGPLDPAGTADVLLSLDARTVSGNEDRIILDETEPSPTLDHVRGALSERHRAFLGELRRIDSVDGEILLFHGTPTEDTEYLLHEVKPDGLCRRGEAAIQERTGAWPERLLLCGHDHLPGVRRLENGQVVVNPGSVGLPAYTDDAPYPHQVENGSPHARYCVIRRAGSHWDVEPVKLAYDHVAASRVAGKNGRDDWAHWLRTGRVR
jgi:predicted phosphodiesterase